MSADAEGDGTPSFVDTNVLVYSVDAADPVRQAKARQLLRSLTAADTLCTSTQVLEEFFVTVTRKIRVPISPVLALKGMDEIANWPVVRTDYRLVREACDLSTTSKISYWDALIVVAASNWGARRIFSEDLNAGQKILGIEIVNPF